MTKKEKSIIEDRLEKLQATIDYNMRKYRETGAEAYCQYADTYREMLYGARGIAIALGIVKVEE